MTITFLHFDSAQRANRNDDPFKSSFTLANSIRNVKKFILNLLKYPVDFLIFVPLNYFLLSYLVPKI